MKTSELTGAALDWAVAKCEGGYNFDATGLPWDVDASNPDDDENGAKWFTPSTNWAQGGPIIEREGIQWNKYDDVFYAWIGGTHHDPLNVPMVETELTCTDAFEYGPTILVAAMRCYVASKLGDEVDIPKELQ